MNGIVFRFIKNISANKRKYLWVVHNMAEQKCGNWWVDKKRFEKGQSGPGSSGQWGQIFIRCHQVRKVKLRPHIRLIRSLRNWNIVYIYIIFPVIAQPRLDRFIYLQRPLILSWLVTSLLMLPMCRRHRIKTHINREIRADDVFRLGLGRPLPCSQACCVTEPRKPPRSRAEQRQPPAKIFVLGSARRGGGRGESASANFSWWTKVTIYDSKPSPGGAFTCVPAAAVCRVYWHCNTDSSPAEQTGTGETQIFSNGSC